MTNSADSDEISEGCLEYLVFFRTFTEIAEEYHLYPATNEGMFRVVLYFFHFHFVKIIMSSWYARMAFGPAATGGG